MEITSNQVDELNLQLAITLEPGDYTTEYNDALKSYRKQVKMPGFRPGHVPIGMVKKMYGKALLAEELNKKLNNTLYNTSLPKNSTSSANPYPLIPETMKVIGTIQAASPSTTSSVWHLRWM